jgi:hypothetical protein
MPIATQSGSTAQVYAAPRQVSDANSQGTELGQSSSDLVSLYGATPVPQPSAAGQAALPQSGASTGAGNLRHYTSTQSPGTGIATISATEQSITVTGVLSTDMVIVNKPTSQSGLANCPGRVSAANTVKLTFVNTSAGTLTPTASEAYIVTTIPANLQLSASLSPAAVAANTTVEQTFTVTGLDVGMVVAVNKPSQQTGLVIGNARVSAKNTLALEFCNVTAATITPTAAETYQVFAANALLATSQVLHMGVNVGTVTGTATITTSEQTFTVAGLATTDIISGVSKPTQQNGIGICGYRVSAANTLAVSYVNPTAATVTPTASEVYDVTVFRPAPSAPMTKLTATLTPTAISANSTAEQTFTISGLVSGQPVLVSAPSSVPGLALTQARISATNTLALTWANVTANSLTPAAGSYTIGQFNLTTPTAGNYVDTLVSPITTLGVNLSNQIRSALVSLGAIAGS